MRWIPPAYGELLARARQRDHWGIAQPEQGSTERRSRKQTSWIIVVLKHPIAAAEEENIENIFTQIEKPSQPSTTHPKFKLLIGRCLCFHWSYCLA